ncbi:TIM44-like domain-containing protein [Neptunomonas sp. XY-337]|uniref:Tim44 domain-containing protein n=1 Tax=Neptunomonas sp. XY-337 TaxID=2561897 RepID=UPI0010AAAA25|nr:TIM44-like domain-containing protein [Neptunomonas sp. XY-337]
MRKLVLSLMMVVVTFGMGVAPEVEAKRLGGGSSLGKSFSSPKKVKPAAAPAGQNAAQKTATAPAKKKGFGGMLGGLLAGGLLAALFFGGAFEGIQFMDILLLALLAFGVFMLVARWKRSQAGPQYAAAGAGNQYRRTPEPVQPAPQQPEHHFTPMSAANTQLQEAELVLPQWFNKVSFLEGAKQHFVHLQDAWDRQDWTDIETYTDAELLGLLKAEREKLPADQKTDVVSVMAELINFIDKQDHVIASIHFYGWIKESQDAQATEFSEIWHLSRDMQQENANWFIVGIEQP